MKSQFASLMNPSLEPQLQWIELSCTQGLPILQILGLPSKEIRESRARLRAALANSGFRLPNRRILLNLSPSGVEKKGTGVELALALTLIANRDALRKKNSSTLANQTFAAWGEVGIDGRVRSVGQVTRFIYAAWKRKISKVFLPTEDERRATKAIALIKSSCCFSHKPPRVFLLNHLDDPLQAREILSFLPNSKLESQSYPGPPSLPLSPLQTHLLLLIASGSHHCLIMGSQGMGKTHFLEQLSRLMPRSTPELLLKQTLLCEMITDSPNVKSSDLGRIRIGTHVRPATLVGRIHDRRIEPGVLSLAHGGVVLADEFAEWSRDSMELLREPLECRKISLSRNARSLELPADFTLIASTNLCPCGSLSYDGVSRCICSSLQAERYVSKLSPALLERINILVRFTSDREHLKSSLHKLPEKIHRIRELAIERYSAPCGKLTPEALEEILKSEGARASVFSNSDTLRSRHQLARIALNLALIKSEKLNESHFREARLYRQYPS